jgi:CDGSH-type Zn-finger protein
MTDLPNTPDHAAQKLVEARTRFQTTLAVAKRELAPKTPRPALCNCGNSNGAIPFSSPQTHCRPCPAVLEGETT